MNELRIEDLLSDLNVTEATLPAADKESLDRLGYDLWHGGARNESNHPRRVIQCQFVAREMGLMAQTQPDIPARLTPAARYILGY